MKMRQVLLLAGLVGLGMLTFVFWDDLILAAEIVKGVRWPYLLLVIPMQMLSYLSNAMFYRQTLAAIGAPVPGLGRLYGLTLGVTFTNIILPSGGASGISLMAAALRKDGVGSGQSAFIQLARFATVYITFIFLLLFALITLYFGDDIARIATRVVVLITALTLAFSAMVVYMTYDNRGFNWLVKSVQRLVDWVVRRFRHGQELIGVDRIERLLGEFHDGLRRVVKDRVYLKQPFWWGLGYNVAEVVSLYLIFIALGFAINPGIVILAYAAANAAGILTVVPGDIGIFEVVMVTTLTLVGVPLAVGVSATILYRVINKLLIIPPGFYFYNHYIKQATHAADD